MVGLQFVISLLFIGGTLFVWNQMHFLKAKKLGIDQERVITLSLPDEALSEYDVIKGELLRHSAILKATGSSFLPSVVQNRIGSTWEGRMEEESVNLWETDSRALVRERFERLVHACIRELIVQDESETVEPPKGWTPACPTFPAEWPPRRFRWQDCPKHRSSTASI